MRAAFSLSRHLGSRLSLLRQSPLSLSHLHTVSVPPSKILQDPTPTLLPQSPSQTPLTLIQDEPMNDFLSHFVHLLRPKLVEAFPDIARHVLDQMLLLICQKVVHKLDGDAAVSDDPPVELSDDLWKTIWDISNSVHQAMIRDNMRHELKKYLHHDEVKEMCRFAGDIGIRGPLLRELRFKWAREKHEEVEFYKSLEKMYEEGTKQERGEEEKPVEKLKVTALPERKSRIKYKIYGLDLSDPKWAEVAEGVEMAENEFVPEEPKPVEGSCRRLENKLAALDPGQADPAPLLEEWKELMEGPRRIDWEGLIERIKEKNLDLYFKVAELLLSEEAFKPTIRDYSRLIDLYSKSNKIEDAKRILSKMTEAGLEPDIITSVTLVHMYSQLGNLDLAQKHFKSLIDAGFKPDLKLYTSMVKACIKAGRPKAGEMLVREMEARDIKPTEEIYAGLVQSFAKIGDLNGAQTIMNMMQFSGVNPDLECYTALIDAYGKLGHPEEARNYFDEMEKFGQKPNDGSTASMVRAYMKKNCLDKALDLLLTLEKGGFKPGFETNTVLVDWMGQLQLVNEAEHFAGIVRETGQNLLELHVILCDMYARVRSEPKMRESIKVLEGKKRELNSEQFERVASGLLAGGFVDDVKRVVNWMKAQKLEPSESIKVALMTSQSMLRPRQPSGRRW
ncbi:Pentatricopeptide repeat-containing protein [Rhynchospora pubera]|uniref:Pentatricopeptide repeat-containing protein n=1 Tax=Rhynchospora pubera TaxID=906938 RepID=A0AAV8DDN2_9POAL|nr:Pentatricopeptide repeat-containing protein [Rhynchospora pubera]